MYEITLEDREDHFYVHGDSRLKDYRTQRIYNKQKRNTLTKTLSQTYKQETLSWRIS